MVKRYIKDTLKIDIGVTDYNQIYKVGPKTTSNEGKFLQQVVKDFKRFSSISFVYRARKPKSNILVHLDLTEQHCLFLKDTYNKVKDDVCIDFACADINCSLSLHLKNG